MVTFTDAGNTLRSTKQTRRGRRPSKKKVSAVEGLPITGGEKVSLKFTDNNGNILDFNDQKNNSLYINERIDLPTGSETTDNSSPFFALIIIPAPPSASNFFI